MPFQIVRNDITNMQVDAIVDTANPRPVIGYGVDAGIHQKAGPELLRARQRIGDIPVGGVAVTRGFDLPAKYVIHTVGPVWQGGQQGETALLRRCYEQSLYLAKRKRCQSVAFPLISAGNHGFPKEIALRTAMDAIGAFLLENEMQVYLVVFSKGAFGLSEKLFRNVSSFIDENYVLQTNLKQYGVPDKCAVRGAQQAMVLREQMRRRQEAMAEDMADLAPCIEEDGMPSPSFSAPQCARVEQPSLRQLLERTDAGFSETLLKLIDGTGEKDSAVYTRANVSRQHFSKIRKDPHYRPTKATAIAFAIALELDLEQTRDLIGRAGYALTNSSKFDVIIMYFIRERNYDMMQINATLFEFDQMLLGV